MHGSQLFHYFQILTPQDRRDLRKFVRSPYFNQREDVVRLYDYLDAHWGKNPKLLKKEAAFEVLFPEAKTGFDAKLMNYALSFLTKTIEAFLTQDEATRLPERAQNLLQKALILRGANDLAERQLDKVAAVLAQNPHRHAEHHRRKAQLHLTAYDLHSRTRRDDATGLQPASEAFHTYALAEILRQACALQTQKAHGNAGFEQPLLATVLSLAATPQYRAEPAVAAYFYAYRALSENAELTDFQELRTILETHFTLFPEADMRGLYRLAINVCIRKMNEGDRDFGEEALRLYRAGLENQILMENGFLSQYTYKNITAAAIKLKAYDWGDSFLETYKAFLPPKDRDNVYSYNLALLRFRQGDAIAAMNLLRGVNLREPLFQLDARRLLARLYFEAGESAALDSLIDSTKQFLHRQKDMGYQREMYLNFFKIMEKYLRQNPKAPQNTAILRSEIEAFKWVADRDWLLENLG